ncbi:DNA-3-methyladenine glycosylase family protein [Brenneria uluponensis]|uniref:DNA-3-methyladenine glycosylase family protein n=1 Tax=Brenneria uluponensis TaxID=3057057 RepID=UPI0028E946F7|nr:DNA-3-methyladenine glycosylase [Brenneria ulupoensis]
MTFFIYGDTETDWLSKRDKRMAEAIARFGVIRRPSMPDLFSALVTYIVEQQISVAAARTVNQRLLTLCDGALTPESVYNLSPEDIQACGMTMKKAHYILGVAQSAVSGAVDLSAVQHMDDQAVIKTLTTLNGVGVWTVEMLLIFSLRRPDVLSWGDLAIQRGMMRLYHHKKLSREQFERYRRRYSPYGTTASLYLWEMAKEIP